MEARGRQENGVLSVLNLQHYSWRFAFAQSARELTVNGDYICFDSLPFHYSAHEGIFY